MSDVGTKPPGRPSFTVYSCGSMGVSGTTPVHVHRIQDAKPGRGGRPPIRDIFEARVGIAIMGHCAETTTPDSDPFDRRFCDNYARGLGTTEDEAIVAMRADMASMADTLWA
jgi:hypothetical protein